MAKRSVTKLLTSPSKVANALDWRMKSGSVLNLAICKEKIDMAVSSHPSFEEPPMELLSIPLETQTVENIKVLDSSVAKYLSSVVKHNNVCGIVVSWPVQERGWCGAPCGRVLHTLDQLTSQSDSLFSKSRPICLWDKEHRLLPEDEWGRTALYSQTPSKDKIEHRASTEQYGDHDTAAATVWNDFCRSHWPELYQRQRRRSSLDALLREGPMNQRSLSASPSSANFPWLHAPNEGELANNQALI